MTVASLWLVKIWPMMKFFYPSLSFSRDVNSFHHRPHGGRQLSWGCHGKYFLREAKLWGRCDRSTRELVNLDEGQGVYPGSAPLEGGKDLRHASSLLLGVDINYKVPISLTRDSSTMGLEDSWDLS